MRICNESYKNTDILYVRALELTKGAHALRALCSHTGQEEQKPVLVPKTLKETLLTCPGKGVTLTVRMNLPTSTLCPNPRSFCRAIRRDR